MEELALKLKTPLATLKIDNLPGIDEAVLFTIRRTMDSLDKGASSRRDLLAVEACLDRLFERINIGHWKEVDPRCREAITVLSYLRLSLRVDLCEDETRLDLKTMFKIIDDGIVFGSPVYFGEENLLNVCESTLFEWKENRICDSSPTPVRFEETARIILNERDTAHLGTKIKSVALPSLETFRTEYFEKKLPIVLTDCISHWPALELWQNIDYIKKVAGHRTVPVEIGSKYTDSEWTQSLITLSEFIDEHVHKSTSEKGYLAQYELFEHIPRLKNDLRIPDYCCISEGNADSEPNVNAWFGPAETVSPIHYDPKHNLLTQVVGEKLVILFPPEEAPNLYLYEENILKNTAKVDPLNPDYDEYPDYKNARPRYAILKPGDMLYIPPKWWHYVKSLTISFSVSFWWM